MAKGQRRDPQREAWWRGVLARFGKSGLSVRRFCAREHVSEPSFYAWRRLIGARDAERKRPQAQRPAFVPVVLRHGQNFGRDDALVMELRGGRALRLPTTMPVGQLADLICAIEAAAESRP